MPLWLIQANVNGEDIVWYLGQLYLLADFPLPNCPPQTLHSFSSLEVCCSFIPANTVQIYNAFYCYMHDFFLC